MRPVLFRLFGISLHSYPALLYLGVVSAILVGSYVAGLADLNRDHVFLAMLLLAVIALLGMRLLYVAARLPTYLREPARIWRRAEGGLSLYGGLIAVPLSVPVLALFGVPFASFWDISTFSMLIGVIFARAGCLLNGCCAGRPTGGRVALFLPNQDGVWCRRIPVQLMEIALLSLLLVGSMLLWKRAPFDGAVFLSVLAGYGGGRVLLENLRERHAGMTRVPVNRIISALLLLGAITMLFAMWLTSLAQS